MELLTLIEVEMKLKIIFPYLHYQSANTELNSHEPQWPANVEYGSLYPGQIEQKVTNVPGHDS